MDAVNEVLGSREMRAGCEKMWERVLKCLSVYILGTIEQGRCY